MNIFYRRTIVGIKFNKSFLKNFTENQTVNQFKTKINYIFNSGVVKIPHDSKKDKGGEDAYAVHDGMICVADGVGG